MTFITFPLEKANKINYKNQIAFPFTFYYPGQIFIPVLCTSGVEPECAVVEVRNPKNSCQPVGGVYVKRVAGRRQFQAATRAPVAVVGHGYDPLHHAFVYIPAP